MIRSKKCVFVALVVMFSLMGLTQAMGWSLKEAAEPYEGKVIYMLINHHTMYDYSKSYISEFEKESGIKIEIELLTRKTMNTKQEFELGSNTAAYDLMHTSTSKSSRYVHAGWCAPLNDYLLSDSKLGDPEYDYEDFVPSARGTFVENDTIYAVPWSVETQVYTYRTDIFEKYGIAGPPSTYGDLENVSRKIYTKEIPAISMRAQPGHTLNTFQWVSFLWGFGGRWFDENLMPVLNSEASIKATEYYCKLLQNWGPEGYRTYIHYDIRNDFQTGKLASYIDADCLAQGYNDPDISNVIGKWAIAINPTSSDGIFASAPYVHGIFIPYDAPNKDAAFLFLQWYTNKKMEEHRAFDGWGAAVCRESVKFSPEYLERYTQNNYAVASNESLERTFPFVRPTWLAEYNEIGDRLGIALQQVLIGEKTAKESLDEINEDIYLILKLGGYYKRGVKNPCKVGA